MHRTDSNKDHSILGTSRPFCSSSAFQKTRTITRKILLCVLSGIGILVTPLRAAPSDPDTAARDIATTRQHFNDLYLRADVVDNKTVKEALAIGPNGSYSDLHYENVKGGFPAQPHLVRLHTLALAYRCPDNPWTGSAELKQKISRGLDFWFKADPQTEHEWSMVIGIPIELAPILTLCWDDLTREQRSLGLAMLKRGNVRGVYTYVGIPATGQNLAWIARSQLEAGLLDGDYNYAKQAADILASNIKTARIFSKHTISEEEGIQPDYSFQQHGPDLYSGGSYGKTFARDMVELAWVTRNTSFSPTQAQLDILAHFILDGQQWMSRGKNWDFGVVGRDINSPKNNATFNSESVARLADLVPSRAPEALVFSRHLTEKCPLDADTPSGNRAFWCADYMSHLRPGYFAGFKMFSLRTIGTESGNGQGLKNYYLPTGAFCLMKTGHEYQNIFPLWNWRRIPGITCAQSDDLYKEITFGSGGRGTTSFVGSVSDGTYGAAAIDLDRDKLKARKAWFCFDEEIVCLGAGIHSDASNAVVTTLEQNWAGNEGLFVEHSGASTPVRANEICDLGAAKWLLHGTTGYYFPQPGHAFACVEKRTGPWNRVENGRPGTVTGWVFDTWIDHGSAPKDASYAYIILPTTTSGKLAAYLPPCILGNTPAQQSIWHYSLQMLQAIFYQAGSVTLPNGPTLSVDAPCGVLARANGTGWNLSVADFTQLRRDPITLTFSGKPPVAFPLPSGADTGRTVTKAISP